MSIEAVDSVRYILICCGFLVIGLNLSVIRHLPKFVVHTGAWTIFMVGQCFFDAAAIYGMHRRLGHPIGTGVVLLALAMGLTLVSVLMLEIGRWRRIADRERWYALHGESPIPRR